MRHNFSRMELAWSYAEPGDNNLQATPLMVKGVVYTTAGIKRAAIALDAKSGKLLWRYDIDEGKRGNNAPRTGSGHGVSYWTDGREERILYVTPGYQLICLDAKTGKPVPGFLAEGGIVDLKRDDDQDINLDGDGSRPGDRPASPRRWWWAMSSWWERPIQATALPPRCMVKGYGPRLRYPQRQAALDFPHRAEKGRAGL